MTVLAGTLVMHEVNAGPIKVEIVGEQGSYQLLRDGEPYVVRGAGTQIAADLESLKRHGGNSVRTWNTDNPSLLDKAHELGITVSLCLDVRRERHGFDYDDPVAVQQQLEAMKAEVLKYRDHPALLTWMIGNELNMDYHNPRVYDAVNDISKMIHELDPFHPTTTATAGMNAEMAGVISSRAPDLDFISVQVYGGLFQIKPVIEAIDFDKPLMVTEWGTFGHWEVDKTSWGAPIELTSHEKAMTFQRGYEEIIRPLTGDLIGNYVFLWGYKQERTPTWYGLFTLDGKRTEAVDVMQQIWTGAAPLNPGPRLDRVVLNGLTAESSIRLHPGEIYPAEVDAHARDELSYKWELMRESSAQQIGGDPEEIPEKLSGLIADKSVQSISLTTPIETGAYRLFVYVYDEQGGAAHANIPFYVVADHEVGMEKRNVE
jgi:hypothetical protein